MKKIAVIGANRPLEPFYKQAKALGYQIIGIAYEKGATCKKYCDKFYPISFVEKDKVLEVCRNEKIDGITSFSLESAVPTVVYVAQNLGLVSNSFESLKRMDNKYAMRESLTKAGIKNPWYSVISDFQIPSTDGIPFPIIVKPIDGGGSIGVTKVEDASQLEDAIQRALNSSKSHQAIIEEFVDGREFSVEYLSHHGNHFNIQITDKVTSGAPNFVELEHHQPAAICEELKNQIKQKVEASLTALDITDSPSHTEIKLNSKGELYIIEVGPRLGGGHITSDLVRLSTGYDLVKGSLELATGDFVEPQIHNTAFSGIYFYSKLTPRIKECIDSFDNYPFLKEKELYNDDLSSCNSNLERNGYVIYQSDHKIKL